MTGLTEYSTYQLSRVEEGETRAGSSISRVGSECGIDSFQNKNFRVVQSANALCADDVDGRKGGGGGADDFVHPNLGKLIR